MTGATIAGIRDNIVRVLNFLNIHNVFNMTLKEKNPLRLNLNRLLCDGSSHTGFVKAQQFFKNNRFPNRWLGRASPVLWPLRNSNLTPMDYLIISFRAMFKHGEQ